MFLALTAQSEYWDKRKKILFLGTWCLRQDRAGDWDGLDFEVLETPWNDRRLFYSAAEQLDLLGERVLDALTRILNDLHGVNFSKRYWRIVVGPWLLHLLHCAYDRHVHLCAAADRDPGFVTALALDDNTPPRDTRDFVDAVIGDRGNMLLMSHILRAMGRRDPAAPMSPPSNDDIRQDTRRRGIPSLGEISQFLMRAAAETYAAVAAGRARTLIHGLHIGSDRQTELLWTGRIRPLRLGAPVSTAAPSAAMRLTLLERLRSDLHRGDAAAFEALLPGLISRFLPSHALEGYATLRAAAGVKRRYPTRIVSAVSWYFDETFKLYAAEAAENGTALVAVQHGGGYGQYLFLGHERHEVRISDRLLVWGWAGQDRERLANIPHPQMSPRERRPGVNDAGRALYVATAEHPRYLYRFHSNPVGSQWPAYYEAQKRFLAALGENGRRSVIFRSLSFTYGQGQYERIRPFFPDISWDDGRPMEDWYDSSRLIIIDHLGTTLLEALGRNVPTIAFWDPARWEVRDAAQPFFNALRAARILWDSPLGAAGHARDVLADPETWWARPEVQKARRSFAETFALGGDEWAPAWAEKIESSVRRG